MYGVRPSGQFGSMAELGGAPLIIVADQQDKKRLTGIEAHKANITAGIKIADTIRTSFGPKGMDKIIVSPDGDVVVTNDGATILKKMPVEHECARLLVDLSQSQDDQIGDGTTGVVILAGALLKEALQLLEKNLHPIKIANGFEIAAQIALAECDRVAVHYKINDNYLDILRKAAVSSMCSKVVSSEAPLLADIVVDAVCDVFDQDRNDVILDMVKVEGKTGGRLGDSKIIKGIALDKEFSHSQMAKEVKNAKIAILSCPFEPPKPKTKHKLNIKSSEAYKELAEREQEYFVDMVKKVKDSGANVVICQWGFDDEANHLLLKNNLPAVRWISGNELELVSLATGGAIVPRFEDLTEAKLGRAACVKEISVGTEDDRMILIEAEEKTHPDNVSPKAVTILLRGSNLMVLQESKRCVHDALCVVRNLLIEPAVVAGGGAVEMACARAVLDKSRDTQTVEYHAIAAFANALTAIPDALAENTGMNTIEAHSQLWYRQNAESNPNLGVDCTKGKISDMLEEGVYESLASKKHQIALATQVVKMILKIDDIIVPANSQH